MADMLLQGARGETAICGSILEGEPTGGYAIFIFHPMNVPISAGTSYRVRSSKKSDLTGLTKNPTISAQPLRLPADVLESAVLPDLSHPRFRAGIFVVELSLEFEIFLESCKGFLSP